MANDILGSELFTTNKSESSKETSKVTQEPKKEGSSLFDNLLKEAKTKLDGQTIAETKSQLPTETKPTTRTIPKVMINSEIKQEIPSEQQKTKITQQTLETKIPDKIVIAPQTKSLLDKMVRDATQNSSQPIKTMQKAASLVDKMVQDVTKVDPKNDQKILTEKATSSKESTSLLDKMVQDAKKVVDPKISLKSDAKPILEKESTLKINKSLLNKETSLKVEPKEISTQNLKPESIDLKSVKKEILSTDENLKQINNQALLNTKNDPIHKKEQSESTSLLDSMIAAIETNNVALQDIHKKEKADIKNPVYTNQNNQKITLDSKHLHSNSTLDVSTKPITSKNIQADTKESKILSSLVDSISGKTKIQKQLDSKVKLESLEDQKVQFGANAFLSNQKVQREILSQQKITEAKEILKEGDKTTKTIKKSADILELNPTHIDMETEEETKVTPSLQTFNKQYNSNIVNQKTILDRAFLTKETFNTPNTTLASDKKVEEGKKVSAVEETKTITKDISITVERTLVETFTTKVIASKQMMGSFMSDVARNMYLNYKPPVTAFKINLDPVNLGNISIIMRSNKSDNSLSISMSMSQNTTYETFNDNKSALQNALGRSFNQNEANISLDFGMQSDSSNQDFERQKEEQENRRTVQNQTVQTTNRESQPQQADLESPQSYM